MLRHVLKFAAASVRLGREHAMHGTAGRCKATPQAAAAAVAENPQNLAVFWPESACVKKPLAPATDGPPSVA